jgi:manganese/zinc/iron transport system permease protein
MEWSHEVDTWIVITGILCALSCSLLGCFLVLRRMSMMGDAISHAVLPGLALAFLITGSRSSIVMFVGAAIVGVLTALLTQWVHTFGKVDRGAAMGVVFTTLFAVGLVMIVRAADHVDLDPGCVLYGAIELVPLDVVQVGDWWVPRAVLVLAGVLVGNALLVGVLYKEFKISSFDPALATTLGINATAMHYLLMTLVAITTVASFEAIGSILVIAMLIVPAAAAHLLTDRLGWMIAASLLIGSLSAAAGHWGAIHVPSWVGFEGTTTTTSGMMASAAGLIFVVVMLLAPRHGVLSRMAHRWRLRLRVVREDVLGLLYRLEEGRIQEPAPAFERRLRVALRLGPIAPRLAMATLARQRLILRWADGWRLTENGRRRARQLVRSHRLWESYLVERMGLKPDHVHDTAMRLEHLTDAALQSQLAGETRAQTDPHGREIP